MEYIIPAVLAVIAAYFFFNRFPFSQHSKRVSKAAQNAELIKVLLDLDEDSLEQLFALYRQRFGDGAARYARHTYRKWKAGEVRPNRETFRRFLLYLPKVMSFDLKCEILREFREAYCARDNHQLTVFTDNWRESLTPLVQTIIEKSKCPTCFSLSSRSGNTQAMIIPVTSHIESSQQPTGFTVRSQKG